MYCLNRINYVLYTIIIILPAISRGAYLLDDSLGCRIHLPWRAQEVDAMEFNSLPNMSWSSVIALPQKHYVSYYIVALKLQLQASRNDKYTAYIQLLCALPYAECPNDLARPFDEYKYSCRHASYCLDVMCTTYTSPLLVVW